MRLLIVIPAYNEEDSISSIIERTLAARSVIVAESRVTEVLVTVVSDGSTDRTVELARGYEKDVKLIIFERNRGYGAAIKTAWESTDAELLAFLDADGTCDPLFFAALCRALVDNDKDMVTGCRLNKGSRMPLMRRIGNELFAWLLLTLSSTRVRDTASGMRVLRKDAVPKLMPLPDGLHFTPAMTARAVLSGSVTMEEIDMPYHERTGQSKLRVITDGVRFLNVFLESTLLYRPSRPLTLVGLFALFGSIALMAEPILYYVQNRSVAEWMIYRFIVSSLAGASAALLFCTSYLSTKAVKILLSRETSPSTSQRWFEAFFSSQLFWFAPIILIVFGGALVFPSFVERLTTGGTYEHWSRYVAMSFFFSVAIVLVVERVLDYCLDLIAARLSYLRSSPEEKLERESEQATVAH